MFIVDTGKAKMAEDIFAFGTIVLCMLTKSESPYDSKHHHISLSIKKNKKTDWTLITSSKLQNTGCTKEKATALLSLGQRCCDRDGKKRPSTEVMIAELETI